MLCTLKVVRIQERCLLLRDIGYEIATASPSICFLNSGKTQLSHR